MLDNKLQSYDKNLPASIEDLTKYVLIGREKLISVKAQIRAIDKIGIAKEVREQKKEEAQDLAGALLDAETKIGELLKVRDKSESARSSRAGKSSKSLPAGITHKQSHYFQTMADNKDIVEQVKAEAKEADDLPTRTEVIRRVKQKKALENIEHIRKREASGTLYSSYDVVIIDPPWPMEKIKRDVRPNQSEFDYPTMCESELAELKIPFATNCHVWLWTTHRFMPMALRLFDVWGLKYICCFVWHKPGGFQPIGLPQYNCEFALYARNGSPKFADTKSFNTCFSAPRGKHSEKPDAFYDMVKRVTVGNRLDMFNRRKIEGFHGWGKEAK